MKVIFIVDDSDVNLKKCRQALSGNYRIFTLPSAAKMFELFEKFIPDLILLDIEMPEMDGFTALQKIKENERTAQIPVVFLTASTDEIIEAHGFELGAVDYVTKPFSTPVLLNRIANHLHIDELIKKRTEHIAHLKNSIVSTLAGIVENRDALTGGHIERTSRYLKLLINEITANDVYAEEMKHWDMDVLISSAQLHDVGKIEITDLILNKPDKLTPQEIEVMQTHTLKGEKIIDQIIDMTGEGEFLRHAKLFAGYHHERWDGKGYPYGLMGENIPLEGRLMAIADVYDALISERPYKKPFTHEQTVEIISKDSGTHFDPKIIQAFLNTAGNFRLE